MSISRSAIDQTIDQALELFSKLNYHVPGWASWDASMWQKIDAAHDNGEGPDHSEIKRNGLGWNITDFGSSTFAKMGLLLLIIRNGLIANGKPNCGKTYAEKAMVIQPGQVKPWHFHWDKTEDLLNRGGGRLVMQLGMASSDEKSVSSEDFTVRVDGIERRMKGGESLTLQPGESVCIPPRMCHQFYAHPKDQVVLAGEISSLNDDSKDNCFMCRCVDREIIEDQEKKYLLISDYR